MTGSPRARMLLGSVVAIAALGCATPEAPLPGPSAKRAIVAPVNFDIVTPNQLEPGIDQADRLVQIFLRHRGLEVERIPLGRFKRVWQTAAGGSAVATDSPEFGSVAGRALSELAPEGPETVLVVASLIYRTGELRGQNARWDGVSERIILEGLGKEWDGLFNEPARGVSIWIRVLDPDGQLLHEGYGGVELPWKIVGATRGHMYSYNISERDDLFQDPGRLALGIKLAFHPYVPIPKQ